MKHIIISFFALVLLSTSIQSALSNSRIILHPVMDPQRNMVASRIPLPEDWQINTPKTIEDPHISGPNGIKVYYRSGGSFSYNQDPYIQQAYRASGQQMRLPLSAEQIIQQDIIPNFTNNRLKFVKQYSMPKIAQRNRAYDNKLYKSQPTQTNFDVVGTEWIDEKGLQILIIVNQATYAGQGSVFWNYRLQVLEAPKKYFNSAKTALIYAIINTQDNPQQIMAYNASEQQKTNQSWAQHNARMRQNQQNFDRQQQIHRSTSEAVNNSIMSTYKSQSAASDRGQQQFINSINEEETVTNPYDGQQYQIDSGANQNWMNNNGEYIQSDDAFYDPNADNDINYQDWQEVEP